jgi:hypothetical protein
VVGYCGVVLEFVLELHWGFGLYCLSWWSSDVMFWNWNWDCDVLSTRADNKSCC